MALTDDQITAKNFRDFYDTIFPYLSGAVHAGFTPVGTIINVIGTTAPANYLKCDGATYSITAYLPLATYIKNQFGAYNHFGGDGVTTFAVPTKAGGTDDIYCIAIRDLNIDLSSNYSENEQVIGTWVDGKPLYQKTLVKNTNLPTQSNTAIKIFDVADLNISKIVDMCGYISAADGQRPIEWHRTDESFPGSSGVSIWAVSLTPSLTIYGTFGSWIVSSYSMNEIVITVRYTKTTD